MTLLEDYKKLRDERVAQRLALRERAADNTQRIDTLLAQTASDERAIAELSEEIDALETHIARAGEYTVPAPTYTPTDSRREAMELVRSAHAEPGRVGRHKSKPDPVKAARKAAREVRAKVDAAPKTPGKHEARDPFKVSPRTFNGRRPARESSDRSRLTDRDVSELRVSLDGLSNTQLERADLLYEIIAEVGEIGQAHLGVALGDFLECGRSTAQAMTSRLLQVLIAQGRVEYTGEKIESSTPGKKDTAVWAAVSTERNRDGN